MKKFFLLILLFSVLFYGISFSAAKPGEEARAQDDQTRIREIPMAMQCWTFRNLSFFETLKKVEKLGIKYLEAYPGQILSKNGDKKFGPDLEDEDIALIKKRLKKHGITLRAFGVTNFENREEAARKTFDFVKKMGIKVLVLEPKYDDYSIIEKMVKEYNIKVAIHNHPKPSKYWNPETVLRNVKGLDRRVGICGDTGHWLRSGINPVEALRKCEGRLHNIHLKDLDQYDVKKAEDVPFGSGKANIKGILAELTRQNYRGTLSVEHERGDEQPDPSASIAKGLEYIKDITYYRGYKELIAWGGRDFHKHGWNHYGPGYFELDRETGIVSSAGGMGLFWFSAAKYANFILELEYKCHAAKTNSGIFLRIPDFVISNDYIYHSFEVQIDDDGKPIHQTGAVYDAHPPSKEAFNPTGEWNHYRIIFNGDHLSVELNGQLVNDWQARPSGKIKDFASEGFIGLQNHGDNEKVSYRNIFIRELD